MNATKLSIILVVSAILCSGSLIALPLENEVPPAESTANGPQNQWEKWVHKYAGSTPFSGANKMNQVYQFNEEILDHILAGHSDFTILGSGGQSVEVDLEEQLRGAHEGKRAMYAHYRKQYGIEDIRDKAILAQIAYRIRTNPADNLLIIYTGGNHAGEFFYDFPDIPVYYTEKVLTDKKLFFTPEFYLFINQLAADLHKLYPGYEDPVDNTLTRYLLNWTYMIKIKGSKNKPFAHMNASQFVGRIYLVELGYLYQDVKRGLNDFTGAELLSGSPQPSNVIMVSDNHFLNGLEPVVDLPDAEALKALGFNSVTVLIEGIERKPGGHSIQSAYKSANYAHDLQRLTHETTKEGRDISMLEFVQKTSPKAAEYLFAGKVQLHPGGVLLITKAMALQKQGMSLSTQGMDLNPNSEEAEGNCPFVSLITKWIQTHEKVIAAKVEYQKDGSAAEKKDIETLQNELAGIEEKLSAMD